MNSVTLIQLGFVCKQNITCYQCSHFIEGYNNQCILIKFYLFFMFYNINYYTAMYLG